MRILFAGLVIAASLPATADLGLAPTTLDFGAQSMGTTSEPFAITVTNNGTASANVASIDVTTGNFQLAHGCASLAPGASCTITVAFHPLPQAGALNSTVAVADTLTVHADVPASTASLQGLAEKSLVTHFYRAVLRRTPDGPGKAYWESEAVRMQALGANVNEAWFAMAAYFFASAEYASTARDDTGFLSDLYRTFFDRDADAPGLAFWQDELAAGVPRGVVLTQFMFSSEFRTISESVFGAQHVAAEIDVVMDMYRGILGRLPDTAGFNEWLGRIRSVPCGDAAGLDAQIESMSHGFVSSFEYNAKHRTDVGYVGDLYNAYLRRGGDRQGVLFWVDQLTQATMTREQVRIAFRQSTEFAQRVQVIGLPGCLMPAVNVGTGWHASLALGGDGFPVIAFTDVAADNLYVVHCADAGCAVRSNPQAIFTRTTEPEGVNSLYLAMASDGLPLIVYSVPGANYGGMIWAAKCGDPACSSVVKANSMPATWSIPQFEVILGADGIPWVLHTEGYCGAGCFEMTYLARCVDASCQAPATARTTINQGFYSYPNLISIGSDGLPLLFSHSKGKYDPQSTREMVKCADATCSAARTASPIDLGSESYLGGVALAMPPDDRAVVFYDNYEGPWVLRLAKCLDAACAATTQSRVFDNARVPTRLSATVLGGGAPAVAYRDEDQGTIRFARCADASCGSTQVTVLPRFGASLFEPSLKTAADGMPMVVFRDGGNTLHFLKCANAECSP